MTAADYDTGEFFHYTYDRVGNPASLCSRDHGRLTQETHLAASSYTFDAACEASRSEAEWATG